MYLSKHMSSSSAHISLSLTACLYSCDFACVYYYLRSRLLLWDVYTQTANIAKLISDAWKKLGPQEKVKWETMAVADRRRYDTEKTLYQGPWHVPRTRKTKDADAPKRPMSSFLAFANSRRSMVKRDMPPDTPTGEVSKTLATMWREAPDEVRQHYIHEARVQRQEYNSVMADWKRKDQTKEYDERNQRVKLALRLIASSAGDLPAGDAAAVPLAYTNPSADLFSDEDLAFTMNTGAVPYANQLARAPPSDRHSYHHASSAHYYLRRPSLDAHQVSLESLFCKIQQDVSCIIILFVGRRNQQTIFNCLWTCVVVDTCRFWISGFHSRFKWCYDDTRILPSRRIFQPDHHNYNINNINLFGSTCGGC